MPVIETAGSLIVSRVSGATDLGQENLIEEKCSKTEMSFLRSIASTAKRLHTSCEKRVEQGLTEHTEALKNVPQILQNVWTAGIKRHNEALRAAANTTLAEAADSVTSANLSPSVLKDALEQGIENRKTEALAAITKVVSNFEEMALDVVEEVKAETRVGIAAVRSSQSYRKALKDVQKLLDDGVSGNKELTASQRELLSSKGEYDLDQIKDTIRERYEKLLTDNADPETFSRKEIRARLERMLDEGPEAVATLVQNIRNSRSEIEHHNSKADVNAIYELGKSDPTINVHAASIVTDHKGAVVITPVVEPKPQAAVARPLLQRSLAASEASERQIEAVLDSDFLMERVAVDAKTQLTADKAGRSLLAPAAEVVSAPLLTVHKGGLYQAEIEATLRDSMATRSQELQQEGKAEVTLDSRDRGINTEQPALTIKTAAPKLAVVTDSDRIAAIIRNQNVTTLRKLATAVSKVQGLAIEGRSKMTKATLITRITGDRDIIAHIAKNEDEFLCPPSTRQNAAASKLDGSKTMTIR